MQNERIERTDVNENLEKRNIGFIPITVCAAVSLGGLIVVGYLVYAHINNL
jgi:hypothetical protein